VRFDSINGRITHVTHRCQLSPVLNRPLISASATAVARMKKSIQQLVNDIETEVRYTHKITGISKFSDKLMQAIENVPRDQFVPESLRRYAFDNGPLPIGYSQTISQPFIVALMTELLDLKNDHKILEVGTGSGYQTAVLAQLCDHVFSIERIAELSELAKQRFKAMNYNNIVAEVGNGCNGWIEHAPYDGIIVTAAANSVPEALINQLKVDGKMVIPVGAGKLHQQLLLVTKRADLTLETRVILDVAFVPLVDGDSELH